jgi:hypothetical protein
MMRFCRFGQDYMESSIQWIGQKLMQSSRVARPFEGTDKGVVVIFRKQGSSNFNFVNEVGKWRNISGWANSDSVAPLASIWTFRDRSEPHGPAAAL